MDNTIQVNNTHIFFPRAYNFSWLPPPPPNCFRNMNKFITILTNRKLVNNYVWTVDMYITHIFTALVHLKKHIWANARNFFDLLIYSHTILYLIVYNVQQYTTSIETLRFVHYIILNLSISKIKVIASIV